MCFNIGSSNRKIPPEVTILYAIAQAYTCTKKTFEKVRYTWEQKFQRAKGPGNQRARELLGTHMLRVLIRGSGKMRICGPADLQILCVKCGWSLRILSAGQTGNIRMRIFSQPLQTAMSSLCALCQPLPLSFVDADDDYDDF